MKLIEEVEYKADANNYVHAGSWDAAICAKFVGVVLGNIPPRLKVTLSNQAFKGSKAIWIKHNAYWILGCTTENGWTMRKRGYGDNYGMRGFYAYAIDKIKFVLGEKINSATMENPVPLFVKLEKI